MTDRINQPPEPAQKAINEPGKMFKHIRELLKHHLLEVEEADK